MWTASLRGDDGGGSRSWWRRHPVSAMATVMGWFTAATTREVATGLGGWRRRRRLHDWMDWIGRLPNLKARRPLRCGCERRPWSGTRGGVRGRRRGAHRFLGVVDGPVGAADGGAKMGCRRDGARGSAGWESGRTERRGGRRTVNDASSFLSYFHSF
jgi:hypothetical protein